MTALTFEEQIKIMNNMDGPPQAAAKQPSPARVFLGAVARRAGRVIGLTPPRLPTTVGESPFAQSVAGSSIRSPADGANGQQAT